MVYGICEHTMRELKRTPKYLVRAIVKSPLRSMPPLWDNVDFVAYSDDELCDFILKKQPVDFKVYGLLHEEIKDTVQWREIASRYMADRERDREEEEFERLRKKLGKGL